MKKIFVLSLFLAAALAACSPTPEPTPSPEPSPTLTATPAPTPTPAPMPTPTPTPEEPKELWGFPIDDTHDAFEVPTGGKLGTVLVTVELLEESREDGQAIHLQVWDSSNLHQPLQELDSYTFNVFHWSDVVDANFDGYMDFGYMHAMGNQPCYWHYWIWNEDEGQFVAEPEFDEISWPEFHPETGLIFGWARGSAQGDGVNTTHRWEDGKLVCVRRIAASASWWDEPTTLSVEDRIDGELRQVYYKEFPKEDISEDETPSWMLEREKWSDLDYHGE